MVPPPASALWLIACWLAAWRLTSLATYESGPYGVMARMRSLLGTVGLGRVAACFHCIGLWISVSLIGIVYGPSARSVVLGLAVAGATSITERALTQDSEVEGR